MTPKDLSGAVWRTSSYTGGEGSNCVQVADGVPGTVPVRDSKIPTGPVLLISRPAWSSFVDSLEVRRHPIDEA